MRLVQLLQRRQFYEIYRQHYEDKENVFLKEILLMNQRPFNSAKSLCHDSGAADGEKFLPSGSYFQGRNVAAATV